MRVHHLNCATMNPVLPGLVFGDAPAAHRHLVAHCLLIETVAGLVLVDSGLGTADIADRRRLGGVFRALARPTLDEAETAVAQLRALGFHPEDVTHVIPTHLDVDHAGGLPDFPKAKVHVLRAERDAALNPGWREKERYRRAHFAHGPDWVLHEADGEPWFGFECVRDLPGLPPEVLLVPVCGHSPGHAAVAIDAEGGWLLHCGDAYFHHGCMQSPPKQPVGLSVFEASVQWNGKLRRHNQARLRELAATRGEVRLFSAHDPLELERLATP